MNCLSFKDFKKHIEDIKNIYKLQNDIDDAALKFNHSKTSDECRLYFPALIDNVIELLAVLTDDKNGDIEYWIYELDFGAKADDLKYTDNNGKSIKLYTIEDLWAKLNRKEE